LQSAPVQKVPGQAQFQALGVLTDSSVAGLGAKFLAGTGQLDPVMQIDTGAGRVEGVVIQ